MMSVVIAASGMAARTSSQDAEVALAPVGAAHRPQHRVRAGLQRHVQRVADVRRLGHRVDHVVGEVARVRGGEPDPLQPVDRAAGPQQLAERVPVAELDAVGVDVLPEQGHLEHALGDQRLDLGEDVAGPAVLLLAAQRRHDAERAGVVAADRDRHPAGVGRLAPGRQRRREDLQRLQDLDLRLAALCRARSSSAGSEPMLWVPKTTSTQGARRTISPRSFWARQPPTAICMPGCASLTGRRWPRLP